MGVVAWTVMQPSRRQIGTFAALVVAQTLHSVEEYLGRLWESFPPGRALTALVSSDRETGFVVINVTLVAFGYWCLPWPISPGDTCYGP